MAKEYVFLSPHLDDAVFSCGGLIAALAVERTPVVCTVFAGSHAPDHVSPLAAELVPKLEQRCVEDEFACAIVGAGCKQLAFLDAPLRSPDYHDWPSIVGERSKDDESLAIRICDELEQSGILSRHGLVFCPLGIGNHIDHRIVYDVGRMLLARGREVIFYEDFPYSIREDCLSAFTFPQDCEASTLRIGNLSDAKFYAMASYKSQIGGVLPEGIFAALSAQANRLGAVDGAERYWLPLASRNGRFDELRSVVERANVARHSARVA